MTNEFIRGVDRQQRAYQRMIDSIVERERAAWHRDLITAVLAAWSIGFLCGSALVYVGFASGALR